MAKTNDCLRRTFTFFNILFAIVGGIIIALALWAQFSDVHIESDEKTTALIVLYVIGSFTLVIGTLGACGAVNENRCCLIVFLVCMVFGTIGMFRGAVTTALLFPNLERFLEDGMRQDIPLDKAPEEIQRMANNIQEVLHCCGMFSYKDWEGNIPDSCLCEASEGESCQNVKQNPLAYLSDTMGQRTIYTQTCFPLVSNYLNLFLQITLGVTALLAALALLGLILSSILIHQLRHIPQSTVVLSVPTIFAPKPPKYQELYNIA